MKKVLSLVSLLLVAIVLQAENTFSVGKVEIKPGEEKILSVVLSNDEEAKSAAIDITLPEELSFVGENGSVVFSNRVSGMMMKSAKIQKSGALRIGLALGETIAAGSGEVFTFKIKANDNASLKVVEMTLSGMSITNTSNVKVTIPDAGIDVTIYDAANVTATSNNSLMGEVQGGNDEVVLGSQVTVTATPNEGYHFTNWTVGENVVSTDSTYTFVVSEDVNLVANFAPNQYTMTFVLDNGQENDVKTQDYATKLTAPTDVQKTGFTFKGWSPEVPATVPASDMTFAAQWERNSYKLTWDVDGVKTESTVAFEAAITKPEDPQKEGYTFAGWTPEVAEAMPAGDVTYAATWTVNQYTISYDLAGGALAEGVTNPASYTIESENFTLVNPTREGYTFAGWTGTGLAEATQTVTIATGSTGNRSYAATWTVNQYTITFVLDNGQENDVKTQDYATGLTAPTDIQKTGFTFKGWSPEVPATVPASDMTFAAQWERNSYKLTWDVDGVKTESTVAFEAAITKPEDPQKEGYTFAGWTPEVAEAMPAGDVTYAATWTVNQYTMTFVLDNGQENIVKTEDYATGLTAPTDVQKTGFTFKGWSPEVPATVPASDMTFTAQWERNSYKLTWDVDGVKTESTVAFEAAIIKPEDPQKEGYTFAGWTPEVAEAMPAGDVTYTATWTVNQYTMTFVLDNGQENIVKTEDYATGLTAPTDVQKTGFTFKGWSPEVPATVPASDMTFTAQWERNSYKLTWDVDGVKTESTVAFEAAITKPEDPQKEGYTFAGWTPEVAEAMPAGDVTYAATWTVNQYTISYDLAGGALAEGVTNPASYTIESESFTLANPTREGYTFAGWTGTGLAEATQTVTIATGSTGNRSYTAIWTIATAIESMSADCKKVDVFDLRGRKVRSNIPVSLLNKELPSGIYIIGGKKVVITK